MCVINDPLRQTQSRACSNHYFHLNFLLCEILKSGDGRTDTTCENIDLYWQ